MQTLPSAGVSGSLFSLYVPLVQKTFPFVRICCHFVPEWKTCGIILSKTVRRRRAAFRRGWSAVEAWEKPAVVFERSAMFTKSRLCKVYRVMAERPSGETPHSHDYMQIWYVTKGCCEHWVEGQKHLMTRGDIFIVPPKIEHQVIRLDGAEIISCEFSFDAFFPETEDGAYRQVHEAALNLSFAWLFLKDADDVHPLFSLRPETGERVRALMTAMLEEYETAGIYYEEFLRVQIMELLLLLAREYSQSPQRRTAAAVYDKYLPLVERAVRYVDEHFREPLRLEDVCRVSTVSKTYFCYLFKLLTRRTLVEYVMDLRVQEAIRLLGDPSNSVTDVGFAVGFGDAAHFSRTFKKLVGVSPRAYRAVRGAKEHPDGLAPGAKL